MKIKPSLLIIAFAFSPFLLFAGEELSFTTYYPSPYGSYHEFRAQHLAVGNTYVTDPDTCWENCPAAATPIDNNTNLVVEGNLRIGDFGTALSPLSRLMVQGSAGGFPVLGLEVTDNAPSPNSILSVTYAGNVGIGKRNPQSPAPNAKPGNLDVNDVYFRSTGKWFSQTILTKSYFLSPDRCVFQTGTLGTVLDDCNDDVIEVSVPGAEPGDVVVVGLPTNYHSYAPSLSPPQPPCGAYTGVAGTDKVYLYIWNAFFSICYFPSGTYTIKVIKN